MPLMLFCTNMGSFPIVNDRNPCPPCVSVPQDGKQYCMVAGQSLSKEVKG